MLCTTRAATPRIVSTAAALGVTKVGIGFITGSAGVDTGAFAGSIAAVEGAGEAGGITGLFTVVAFDTGAGLTTWGTGAMLVDGVAGVAGVAGVEGVEVFGSGGVPPNGAPGSGGKV
jgi:hypothetical protein